MNVKTEALREQIGTSLYEALKKLHRGEFKGEKIGRGILPPDYAAVLIEVERATKDAFASLPRMTEADFVLAAYNAINESKGAKIGSNELWADLIVAWRQVIIAKLPHIERGA